MKLFFFCLLSLCLMACATFNGTAQKDTIKNEAVGVKVCKIDTIDSPEPEPQPIQK